MLSVSSVAFGYGHYLTNLAREDYYVNGGEQPGRWRTQGAAEEFGLTGEVTKEHLANLLEGFGPDGEKLVQNAGRSRGNRARQAGIDLTFSAPKSVSILWGLGNRDTQRELEAAQHRAVGVALDYLQEEAAWTRKGRGSTEFERCKLVFASFLHTTSRAQDPNVHTHVLVPNVCLSADGKTRAIWNNELYQHKMAAGALYRVALAHELRKLGYGIEADTERGLFEVAGVSEKLIDHFSKRRAQVEREVEEQGYSKTAAAFAKAARDTRHRKGHVAVEQLVERWTDEAMALGWKEPRRNLAAPNVPERSLRDLALAETERLGKERATFRPQDVLRAVACKAQGTSTPEQVLAEARAVISGESVLEVGRTKRNWLLTTRTNVNTEGELLHAAAHLDSQAGLRVRDETAEWVTYQYRDTLTEPERRDAFRHLTQDRGNLKLLAGYAGTGKTTLLRAAREAWEREGFTVVGMALSGKAARELQDSSGIQSETVAKRELQMNPGLRETLRHHGRELYRAARWGKAAGYKPEPMERLKLDSETVLVIDESSMVGLEDTTRLLLRAQKAGAKVVMVGDEEQLPAINAVSPFEALGQHIGRAELRGIKRQRDPWMREAVHAFASGDPTTGLALFQEHGCLQLSKGGPAATKDQLVSDWMRSTTDIRERMVLTWTNAGARSLNQLIHSARMRAGELGIAAHALDGGEEVRKGDRVLFAANNRKMGVWNGDVGTVRSLHHETLKRVITVDLDNGRAVRVDLDKYKTREKKQALFLGYALTTHKAQGATVDETFVYTTPSRAARDMTYVQVSRAREKLTVYAPGHDLGEDLGEFARTLEKDTTRPLALEVQAMQREAELTEEHTRERGRERTR